MIFQNLTDRQKRQKRQKRYLAGSCSLMALATMSLSPAYAQAVTATGEVLPGSVQTPNWTVSDPLYIGQNTTGSLTIGAGGTVNSQFSSIGEAAGSNGQVLVEGAGASWTHSGVLYVGRYGRGNLTIGENGALTSNDDVIIANRVGSTGKVSVAGQNGSWTSKGTIYVGDRGAGELDIHSGGKVISKNATLGGVAVAGVSGVVNVSGAGSSWTNTGMLTLADGGSGALNITEGGYVSTAQIFVGFSSNSTGNIVVSGASSIWENAGYLDLGRNGYGGLTVADGGLVSIKSFTALATNTGGKGQIDLMGTEGARGTLQTLQLRKSVGLSAKVNFHGGVLRATKNHADFLQGFAAGDIVLHAEGGFIDSNGYTIAADAPFSGSGRLAKLGAGTLTLTGTSTHTGGTTVLGGVLSISDNSSLGADSGDLSFNGGTLHAANDLNLTRSVVVLVDGGTLDTDGKNVTINGSLGGVGHFEQYGGGDLLFANTVTLGGLTIDADSFAAASSIAVAGDLSLDVLTGDIGQTAMWTVGGSSTFNAATGNIMLLNDGNDFTGSVNLSGDVVSIRDVNSITLQSVNVNSLGLSVGQSARVESLNVINAGQTEMYAGQLLVNGQINGAVKINDGASLGGAGTVGDTVIATGGILSPGNSIGTLSVSGNLLLNPGSLYQVEIAASGLSDRTDVSGRAIVTDAQVSVLMLDPETSYQDGQTYRILNATGGVTGRFLDVVSQSAFLDFELDHGTNSVDLRISLKGSEPEPVFIDQAKTANQFATATALDNLQQSGPQLALYNDLLMLSGAQARTAFDQLSGEIHASGKAALIEDSRFIREAAIARLRTAFDGVGVSETPALTDAEDGQRLASAVTEDTAIWGHAFGSWSQTDGNGNAADFARNTSGFLTGLDGLVATDVRVGLMAGYSRSTFDIDDRASSGSSDNYHLGVYGGAQWGNVGLRSGLAYTWHDIETGRSVVFPSFADSLKADYRAGTFQAFSELGYRIDMAPVAFEPFANLAYVSLSTKGFAEQGGAAALHADGQATDATFTTLGARASIGLDLGGVKATARGTIGWRHVFDDDAAVSRHAFLDGSAFTVSGVPISRDAAVLEAGFDFALSSAAKLGLTYQGQLSSDTREHSIKAGLNVRF